MTGNYDISLVLMSYLIATLASFTALELAGRVASSDRWRPLWLVGGSLAMGTGIWSMHFVGMSAFSLPIEITYDLWLTVYSWVAAILVSALALWTIARAQLTPRTVLLAAMMMGAGICAMHYTGMYAMRMQPPLSYDPILFVSSILIAVLASAAALVIAFQLRVVASWNDVFKRIGAAFLMGFAIVGMHYTGMAATEFAPGSFCSPDNQLSGNWVGGPVLVVALLILPLSLSMGFGIANAKLLTEQERDRQRMQEWVASRVYIDSESELANRSGLIQAAMAAIRVAGGRQEFAVVSARVTVTRLADGFVLQDVQPLLPAITGRLRTVFGDDSSLARLGGSQFAGLILAAGADRIEDNVVPRLQLAFRDPVQAAGGEYRVDVEYGYSVHPADGASAQMLLAKAVRQLRRLGREPEGVRAQGGVIPA